ncbi:hypothetical protein DCC85_04745 [Paenibacillus sp. CAA11]|uniref:hypothetical protein n=1 Tax=Paenibacillus sp. CAA11 TaxID=1532905 RepID=UPI000D358E5E|nr:hypothetical protein [Paenibacillus sp. CAA11]AWB43600.1 hypothetical protein DCC85_04745 [Paenibacillus sp. CAA11]
MNWLHHFTEDLTWSFQQAEHTLSQFVPPFDQQALLYLDRFNVLKHQISTNYICFLLPFWMQESTGLSRENARRMAAANLYGMMYFHLQDEVMDEVDNRSAERLPLANLIYTEFISGYSRLFPPSSPFWSYYKRYLNEWALAVTTENERDIVLDSPILMGHKAAPVKLASTGALLLSGHSARIPETEHAVDQVLSILQMLDDWEDWNKDLQEGSYNSLLAYIRADLKLPDHHRLTPEDVMDALYVHGVLTRYAEYAQTIGQELSSIIELAPDLYEFYIFLLDNLTQGASSIERERCLLEQGGLQYWLSKNISL